MASIRRAATRSIEASNVDHVSREQEIRTVTNPAKRAGLLAIHKAATSYPRLTSTILGTGPGNFNITKIGSGYVSDVYKLGDDTVLKVDKDSVGLSRRERRQLADRMLDEHQALVEYVGLAVLPHTIDIGPHPEHRFMKAVRITQPYIELDFIKLNEQREDIPLLADRIRQANAKCPSFLDELGAMVSDSRSLFADRQLSTDILGIDNVGVTTASGHLTVVDAQPINDQHPTAQAAIGTYFDHIEAALQLAA
jgi:hypothetical protein